MPKFHYTKDEERRLWTCAIYPHAELFLRLPGSIPWKSWVYDDGVTTAQFNPHVPYYAMGGSVEELYNIKYKYDIPADEDLHVRTDPTGDIDIRISPMIAYSKISEGLYRKYRSSYEEALYTSDYPLERMNMFPFFENATTWLFQHVIEYFQPKEALLNKSFPSALPYFPDEDEGHFIIRAERVGPLTVVLMRYRNPTPEGYVTPITKIQVKLRIPKKPLKNTGNLKTIEKNSYQDHMIEMGFFYQPNEESRHSAILYRPFNIWVRNLEGEVYGCHSAITSRLLEVFYPELQHRPLNYVYRLRFLLSVMYSVYKKSIKEADELKAFVSSLSPANLKGIQENVTRRRAEQKKNKPNVDKRNILEILQSTRPKIKQRLEYVLLRSDQSDIDRAGMKLFIQRKTPIEIMADRIDYMAIGERVFRILDFILEKKETYPKGSPEEQILLFIYYEIAKVVEKYKAPFTHIMNWRVRKVTKYLHALEEEVYEIAVSKNSGIPIAESELAAGPIAVRQLVLERYMSSLGSVLFNTPPLPCGPPPANS